MRRLACGPWLPFIMAAALVLVSAVPLAGVGTAVADTASEQREVKRQRAEVASQLNALEASDAEVSRALADLQANVSSAQAQMTDAQSAMDQAEARAIQAEREARATEDRIAVLRAAVVAAAVDAYVEPEGEKLLWVFRESSANDANTKQALMDVANGGKLDAVEAFRTAQRELEDQRDEARSARDQAEQRRQGLAEKVAGYESAHAQQQQVAAKISERLNDKLAEAQALAALDQQLADKLAAEQQAIAAQLAAARVAAERNARSSGGGGPSSGGGGASSGGAPAPVPVIPQPGGLTTVRGIVVADSIAGNLAAMLEAASAAGINLTGSGYRDSSRQIALRRQNCGTSDYAVYQMNPDACRPPTAIPGRSKHERGLAVDFAHNGRTIQSRSSEAFQWLAANAARYGFHNLPSEPWHWSNDGS